MHSIYGNSVRIRSTPVKNSSPLIQSYDLSHTRRRIQIPNHRDFVPIGLWLVMPWRNSHTTHKRGQIPTNKRLLWPFWNNPVPGHWFVSTCVDLRVCEWAIKPGWARLWLRWVRNRRSAAAERHSASFWSRSTILQSQPDYSKRIIWENQRHPVCGWSEK